MYNVKRRGITEGDEVEYAPIIRINNSDRTIKRGIVVSVNDNSVIIKIRKEGNDTEEYTNKTCRLKDLTIIKKVERETKAVQLTGCVVKRGI